MARRKPPPPPLPAWDAAPAYTQAKGEFAKDMEVTPAAVSQWLTKGLPVRPDGLLDLFDAAKWLIDTLDPMQARATRAEARSLYSYLIGQMDIRRRVRQTVEAAARAAHAAGLAAGLDDDAAGLLADRVAAATVEGINPHLEGDGNLPLPVPPPGLWARIEEEEATVEEEVEEEAA